MAQDRDPAAAVFDPDLEDEAEEPEAEATEDAAEEETGEEPEQAAQEDTEGEKAPERKEDEESPATGQPEAEKGESEEKPPEGEPEKETKEPEKPQELYKLKVDGADVEVTLQELKDGYGLAQASHGRLRKAAELTQSAKQVIDMVMDDPIGVAIQLKTGAMGGNREQAEQAIYDQAARWVAERLKEELLPENEREIARRERLVRAEEQRIQSERQRIERERFTAQQAVLAKQIDKQIADAVNKAGLRNEPQVFDMMLRELYRYADAGENLTPEAAASIVKEKLSMDRGYLLKGVTPEDLEKVNPELIQALRERDRKAAEEKARNSNRASRTRAPRASNPRQRRDGASSKWYDVFDPDR